MMFHAPMRSDQWSYDQDVLVEQHDLEGKLFHLVHHVAEETTLPLSRASHYAARLPLRTIPI
jgi:hypothetical protein